MSGNAIDAVKQAAASAGITESDTENTVTIDFKKDPVSETEEVEETEETVEAEETEETEEVKPDPRVQQALKILEALEDPIQGRQLIQTLYKQAGLDKAETKAEEKTASKKFDGLIRQALGSEYEFLADKLGGAFQTLAETLQAESEAKIQQIERDRIARETSIEIDRFYKENKVTEADVEWMNRISEDFPPNPARPVREYLKKVLHLAREEQKAATSKVANVNKVKTNLEKKSVPAVEPGKPSGKGINTEGMSARDVVLATARQLRGA